MLCAKVTTKMSYQQWQNWVSPDFGCIEVRPSLRIPTDAASH
jgi:hypothetical protein